MLALEKDNDFQISDLQDALMLYGDIEASRIRNNPKLLKVTFDILIANHEALTALIGKQPGGAAAALIGGYAAPVSELAGASKSAKQAVRSASLATNVFKLTVEMANVVKLSSPLAITAFLGAATIQKSGGVVSFIADDSDRAACWGAIMELAGSATLAAITAPTGVLLVLSAASVSFNTVNAYLVCSEQSR